MADLASALAHRRWVRRTDPFPHVVAQNVFVPEFYEELVRHFRRIEEQGAFQQNIRNYDAGNANVRNHKDGPLGVFVSREWHDLIAGVAGVEATGDVSAGLHSHPPGGRRGWPHNDLNPGWFAGAEPGPDEVRLDGDQEVNYQTGVRPEGVEARQTMRAVALLFYLANPEWEQGDGGETGIFGGCTAGANGKGIGVPPVNNSLMLFECTPFTWHAYAGNARNPRNCLVMWLHRRKQVVIDRFGEQNIAHW